MLYERNEKLDLLKGFACTSVVLFHVIGYASDTGLRVDSGWLRVFADYLDYLQMPIFSFVSGVIYALNPAADSLKVFFINKVRRIIIPMLTVGTVFFLLQNYIKVGDPFQGIESIHIFPVAHFWYLESIFLVFVLFFILDKFASALLPVFLFLCFFVYSYLNIEIDLFSFSGFMFLFPYFVFGVLVCRSIPSSTEKGLYFSVSFVVLFFSFMILSIFEYLPLFDKYDVERFFYSLVMCFLLYRSNLSFVFLSWIGKYSYTIFLFHVFFTAAARIILYKVGIESLAVHVFIGVFCGMIGPIVVHFLVSRSKFLSPIVLGFNSRSYHGFK